MVHLQEALLESLIVAISFTPTDKLEPGNDAWQENVQEWPQIDDGIPFSYILNVKVVDIEYIGKFKDQKAYSYWHLPCAGLSEEVADSIESWACYSCLGDIAYVDDASDSDSELNINYIASSSCNVVDLAHNLTTAVDSRTIY
ncbi:hypothetical protein AWC38_SpisGene17622 [Stylophora pistillata]|uniref:Uncharacterized protein n=1 Tax=Stylophora pistillata TaxID=50429 RepID=A0A2B4RP63_STYPI|nr:hypothetical protein AWC38_SpisGene17622 [Stylophora pistillata]